MSAQPVDLGRFEVGQAPKFLANCLSDSTGLLADPTTIKVVTRDPAGTEADYVYGTDGEVTKLSTGKYQYAMGQLTGAMVGSWRIRWNATGALISARTGIFEVVEDGFTTPLP